MRIKKFIILCFIICFSQIEIKAQEISMSSGFLKYQYYHGDKKINKKELTSLLESDILAFNHWKRSETFNTLSWIALISEAGFATWGIIDNNPKNDTVTKIGVYGSFAAVIAFSILSHAQKKKAVLKYNQGLDKSNTFSIKPSKNGFGIVMQF